MVWQLHMQMIRDGHEQQRMLLNTDMLETREILCKEKWTRKEKDHYYMSIL